MPRDPDVEECRALLAAGSRTFSLAARLLPARVRDAMTVLYAFCRVADDAVDGGGARADAPAVLRRRLGRAYDGRPEDAVERSLARVVRAFSVPRALLEALLEGFAWDLSGRRYETLEDLQGYAARVAGAVGAMSAVVMGVGAPGVLARACDLGVAMQLTNVARDVGEDAARGRIYLPLAWLREEGVDPDAWLTAPEATPAIRRVVARLLAEADVLYRRADQGIPALPGDCRVAISAARRLYAEIGRRVARAGFDSVTRRAVVPAWKKVWLVLRSLGARLWRAPPSQEPPLPATGFLVAAVAQSR